MTSPTSKKELLQEWEAAQRAASGWAAAQEGFGGGSAGLVRAVA